MRKMGLFPAEKPKNPYKPKPYEQMTYPGQRVQVDVKVCLLYTSNKLRQHIKYRRDLHGKGRPAGFLHRAVSHVSNTHLDVYKRQEGGQQMKDNDLLFDRKSHVLYSKPCKKEILAKIVLHLSLIHI